MALPTDPIMLLSVVNLKLRDYFKNLDALCEDLDVDKTDLCAKLRAVGYEYDAQRNRFILKRYCRLDVQRLCAGAGS